MRLLTLGLLAIVSLGYLFKGRVLSNAAWQFFRVFFPSWRFFENLTPLPKILYRVSRNGIDYSDWEHLNSQPPSRTIGKLFHNPEENLALTYQVQLENLLNDISASDCSTEFFYHNFSSYQIVLAHIKDQIHRRHAQPFHNFQFKVGVWIYESHEIKTQPVWTEALLSCPERV
jgi:hypothetical protein